MEQKEFEDMATELHSRLMAVARGCGLGDEEAEDAAQDTMLKLWTIHDRLPSGMSAEPTPCSVSARSAAPA